MTLIATEGKGLCQQGHHQAAAEAASWLWPTSATAHHPAWLGLLCHLPVVSYY
jgi:hypothetical protein